MSGGESGPRRLEGRSRGLGLVGVCRGRGLGRTRVRLRSGERRRQPCVLQAAASEASPGPCCAEDAGRVGGVRASPGSSSLALLALLMEELLLAPSFSALAEVSAAWGLDPHTSF